MRAFARAGRELDIDVVRIDRNDYGRIAEFDALFIRETTYVDHPTYRFARRAGDAVDIRREALANLVGEQLAGDQSGGLVRGF